MLKRTLIIVFVSIGLLFMSGCNLKVTQNPQENGNSAVTSVDNTQIELQKPVLASFKQTGISEDGKKINGVFNWTGNAHHYDLMVRYPGEMKTSYVKAPIYETTTTDVFAPNENPYTWWIRAHVSDDPLGSFIDSDFGQFTVSLKPKVSRVTTEQGAISLQPAELISPAEITSSSPENWVLTFSWIGNGEKYDLMIQYPGDSDFKIAIPNLSSPYDMEMNGSSLGTYYWKIRSYDAKGNFADSDIRKFAFGND